MSIPRRALCTALIAGALAGPAYADFKSGMSPAQIAQEIKVSQQQGKSTDAIAQAALAAGLDATVVTAAMIASGIDAAATVTALVKAGADPSVVATAAIAAGADPAAVKSAAAAGPQSITVTDTASTPTAGTGGGGTTSPN